MKKRKVFKKWVQTILEMVAMIAISLIMISVDSEWNLVYLKFVLFNSCVAGINIMLLKKYGVYNLDEE